MSRWISVFNIGRAGLSHILRCDVDRVSVVPEKGEQDSVSIFVRARGEEYLYGRGESKTTVGVSVRELLAKLETDNAE